MGIQASMLIDGYTPTPSAPPPAVPPVPPDPPGDVLVPPGLVHPVIPPDTIGIPAPVSQPVAAPAPPDEAPPDDGGDDIPGGDFFGVNPPGTITRPAGFQSAWGSFIDAWSSKRDPHAQTTRHTVNSVGGLVAAVNARSDAIMGIFK